MMEKLIDALRSCLCDNTTVFVDEWMTEIEFDYESIAKELIALGVKVEEIK